MLDAAVTILDMVRDGCALVPPAFFKPAVNLAYGLLKAVKVCTAKFCMARVAYNVGLENTHELRGYARPLDHRF
jgi:hypothetical protein